MQAPLSPETGAELIGPPQKTLRRRRVAVWAVLLVVAGSALAIWQPSIRDRVAQAFTSGKDGAAAAAGQRGSDKAGPTDHIFRPTPNQLSALQVEAVRFEPFLPDVSAEGRIALNDDDNVPVYSPYAGRVVKILARAGDDVKQGQVLFTVAATDMVQAQNDFESALNGLDKAQAQLKLDQTIAARQQELFAAKAVALKDYQSAQNDVIGAQSDLKTAESALQAVKNRLRLLGKSDAEIAAFAKSGSISPETEITAPIAGTVVQRKVGNGQYLSAGSDPVFVIGDLSTVWLLANVRESDIPKIHVGQEIEAQVVGYGQRIFKGRIDYMAASLDPATRRLTIRSEIENRDRLLRPEMFATFRIVTGGPQPSPSVPLTAIVYEGSAAHVWVVRSDGAIQSRDVKLGIVTSDVAQVVEGLAEGEHVVTRGALFIDRAVSGDKAS